MRSLLQTPEAILLAAVTIDALYGELPARVHPVVGIGRFTTWLLRYMPARGATKQLWFGLGLTLLVVSVAASTAWALSVSPGLWGAALEALLLSSLFAVRGLVEAGRRMRHALGVSVEEARLALSHLCSRSAEHLTPPELAGATVESLSENTSDSFVAPLFWYVVFAWLGLPGLVGAALYRASNTLDAMIGYRGRYEYIGKAAARLDDALNWVPARLTAVAIAAASGSAAIRAWRTGYRDHRRTASPNAGWPMATIAGALCVRLEKRGEYVLAGEYPQPSAEHVHLTERLVILASVLCLGLFLAVLYWSGR